jgi:hypothetical protein
VLNLSVDTLAWQCPDVVPNALAVITQAKPPQWQRTSDRHDVFQAWNDAAARLYTQVLDNPATPDAIFAALGLVRAAAKGQPPRQMMIDGVKGTVSRIEIGAVRPAWRVSPTTGNIHSDVIVEMTQQWMPADSSQSFRGGCTIICGLDTGEVRYVIRKRVGHSGRTADQESFRGALTDSTSQTAYFIGAQHEPFAMMHRGV